MSQLKSKNEQRLSRHRKIRSRVSGNAIKPRLAVFRSNKHLYAQLIDDTLGRTIAAASDREIKKLPRDKEVATMVRKQGEAYLVGQLLATKALGTHIKTVVFDRGGYLFAGRVKAVADGARRGGLIF